MSWSVAESAYERALFTGFRNLVIEQFEYEPVGTVSRGNLQRFVRTTHRPAGLLSTEMSKKVRFLTMVANGQHPEDERPVSAPTLQAPGRARGCDL